jgi:Tol biopolymer transport system component
MTSEVCIFELADRSVSTVLKTDRLVEAPNWTPDGAALIINGDGRLFRVDLADPQMEEINSDFAVACNNDHGISPDGKTLVISDSTEGGKSCIYTLPIRGGVPKRITKDSPSYWHGWSPDGSTLAYVAKRTDVFNVYTIPAGGGDETCLTSGFEHTDGPDYTTDCEWIWFNGQKQGCMQLWRMRTDGSDAEQMTDDERWNWFPHPSPDGKKVLYVAYEPGVTGHPRYKDVELRMLPASGGTPDILLEMFGGQGTINVPCWAPDGNKFAFVRYDRPDELYLESCGDPAVD